MEAFHLYTFEQPVVSLFLAFVHHASCLILSCVCCMASSSPKVVVGADALTRWMDWSDRNVCILFGDGAGAVVLQV